MPQSILSYRKVTNKLCGNFLYDMKLKEIYKTFLFYLTVPKCACCDGKLSRKNTALCDSCYGEYLDKKSHEVCSVCFKPLYECKCSNDYLDRHYVHALCKIFRYKPTDVDDKKTPQNELVYKIKRGNRRDIVKFIAEEMAESIKATIKGDVSDYIITNVPRQKARRKKYGVDHSKEIAKGIGKELSVKYKCLLTSRSKMAQKKTRGEGRIKNADFDYKFKGSLKGKRVIIIDDIVTTGASLGACAALIKGLGAKSVIGACFSIAYKDPGMHFEMY